MISGSRSFPKEEGKKQSSEMGEEVESFELLEGLETRALECTDLGVRMDSTRGSANGVSGLL